MAVSAHTTISYREAADESLTNALWFLRNGRPLAALYALRNAFDFEVEPLIRGRVGRLVEALETVSVAMLPVPA